MRIPLTHGLAGRVSLLSRIMAADDQRPVAWCISRHFPYGHREVFPDGIEGVDLVDEPVGTRIGYLWSGATDEGKRAEAVRRLFAAMKLPDVPRLELGILFRGHRPDGKRLAGFSDDIRAAMAETEGGIATLCDSQRAEIREILGGRMIAQATPEMTHDMDREGLDVRGFVGEWWALLNCQRIITNCPMSSLDWPHAALMGGSAAAGE